MSESDPSESVQVSERPPQLVAAPEANPFQRPALPQEANIGAVEIESQRAIAEAQGKLVIAKRFPRNQFEAAQKIKEACHRPGLAKSAVYKYARGASQVAGPSIRLAEEIARCWGNIDYGLRELSNRNGVSEMEAYAWDMETNTMSTQRFTVAHIRDRKDGPKALTDQRDIYEITANMGARRMRARILAIIPDDIVDMALAEVRATLAGGSGKSLTDTVNEIVAAFAKLGVTVAHLETYLEHELAKILPDEIADLRGVYNMLKEGQAKASDYFGTARIEEMEAPAPRVSAPAQAAPAPPKRGRGRPPKPATPEGTPPPAPAESEPVEDQEDGQGDDGDLF